jgi:hypothetical protein
VHSALSVGACFTSNIPITIPSFGPGALISQLVPDVSGHSTQLRGQQCEIFSSAGSNTMQRSGDSVSPPYHHVHARKSTSPIPAPTKTHAPLSSTPTFLLVSSSIPIKLPPQDPDYDHEQTARMCARYVNILFHHPHPPPPLRLPSRTSSHMLSIAQGLPPP